MKRKIVAYQKVKQLWPEKSAMGKLAKKASELRLSEAAKGNEGGMISRSEILMVIDQVSEANPYRHMKSARWYEDVIRKLIRTVLTLERRLKNGTGNLAEQPTVDITEAGAAHLLGRGARGRSGLSDSRSGTGDGSKDNASRSRRRNLAGD